jgi:hypothetical protein
MKCKIFTGKWYEAQDAFNQWAKGKALTREVLIHEQIVPHVLGEHEPRLMIVVYHPEDPHWDETPQKPAIPVYEVPIPKTKVEEIKVTQ